MEIIKHIEGKIATIHHALPRLRWVHQCQDGFAVHLSAFTKACPCCDAVNENYRVACLNDFSLAA
jgi:hypothetical protein